MTVRGRGSADEAVVVVKLEADEGAVTHLRVKLSASDLAGGGTGGEGRNMSPRFFFKLIRNHRCEISRKRSRLWAGAVYSSRTESVWIAEHTMQRQVK